VRLKRSLRNKAAALAGAAGKKPVQQGSGFGRYGWKEACATGQRL